MVGFTEKSSLRQLRYNPCKSGIVFGQVLERMRYAIITIKPETIMIKGNPDELQLLSKYFQLIKFSHHTPIVPCHRVIVPQPGALLQEVHEIVLKPLVFEVQATCPGHDEQHTGNPRYPSQDEVDHCALIETLYYAVYGMPGAKVGDFYQLHFQTLMRYITLDERAWIPTEHGSDRYVGVRCR